MSLWEEGENLFTIGEGFLECKYGRNHRGALMREKMGMSSCIRRIKKTVSDRHGGQDMELGR